MTGLRLKDFPMQVCPKIQWLIMFEFFDVGHVLPAEFGFEPRVQFKFARSCCFFENQIRCTGHRPHKSHVVQQESFVDVAI